MEFPFADDDPEIVSKYVNNLKPDELIEWLYIPINSVHPELYTHKLPSGLEYLFGPVARSCFDFALRLKKLGAGDIKELRPSNLENGAVAIYYLGSRALHAGIVIEGGDRIISQWGDGAVFKSGLKQLPKKFGSNPRFFNI